MRKRSARELKYHAKRALEGKYGTAILGVLVSFGSHMLGSLLAGVLFGGTTILNQILSQVFLFAISLVTGVLSAGLYYMYLNMARGREFGMADLVYFFKNQPDRVIVAGFFLALIELIVSIPYYWYSYTVSPGTTVQEQMNWMVDTMALMLLALVLNFLFTLPFAMTYLLQADDPELGGVEALKSSFRMMKGNMGRYLRLLLSFLPLMLLSIFTFWIAMLWLLPYMEMSTTVFYMEQNGELDEPYERIPAKEIRGDDYNSEA